MNYGIKKTIGTHFLYYGNRLQNSYSTHQI